MNPSAEPTGPPESGSSVGFGGSELDGPAVEAARATRTARGLRAAFAATLALEALTVLFVPRAIAQVGAGLTGTRLAILLTLAAVLVAAAFGQRTRGGRQVGTMLQLALVATGLLTTAMYVLGVIFGLVWLYLLKLRRDLLGGRPHRA